MESFFNFFITTFFEECNEPSVKKSMTSVI
jgi:hypothetical protein